MKTISIDAERHSPKRTTITTADGEFIIGQEGSPLEYLLGSLAGCINVIGTLVADDMGIEIESLTIDIDGEIDPSRYLGKTDDGQAGFQSLAIDVEVETDASEETVEEWLGRVQDRCPVAENLRDGTDLSVTLQSGIVAGADD